MDDTKKIDTIRKKSLSAANFVLALLLFFLVVAVFVTVFIRTVFLDIDKYTDVVFDSSIIDMTYKNAYNALESECLFYNIPVEEVSHGLVKAEIVDMCRNNTDAAIKKIFKNTKITYDEYPGENFMVPVKKYLQKYSEENNLILEKSLETEIVKSFSKNVTNAVNSTNHAIISKLPSFEGRVNKLLKFSDFQPIFIVSFAAVFLSMLLINRKKLTNAFYYIIAPIWCAVIFVAIPACMLAYLDIEKNIRIAMSPLRVIIYNLVNHILNDIAFITIPAVVVSSFLLILSIIVKFHAEMSDKKLIEIEEKPFY